MEIFNSDSRINLDELNTLLFDKALDAKFNYDHQSLSLDIICYQSKSVYKLLIKGVIELHYEIDDHVEIYIDHISFIEEKLTIAGVNGCLVASGEKLEVRIKEMSLE
jgi:hypothetical protein